MDRVFNTIFYHKIKYFEYTYRITAFTKVGTNITASITASPVGQSVIVVIICVDTFKADVIVFIVNDINMILFVVSHR